jgi:hypothetical protein
MLTSYATIAMGKLRFVNQEDLPECLAEKQPKLVAFLKAKDPSCLNPQSRKRGGCDEPSSADSGDSSSTALSGTSDPSSTVSASSAKSTAHASVRVPKYRVSTLSSHSAAVFDFEHGEAWRFLESNSHAD